MRLVLCVNSRNPAASIAKLGQLAATSPRSIAFAGNSKIGNASNGTSRIRGFGSPGFGLLLRFDGCLHPQYHNSTWFSVSIGSLGFSEERGPERASRMCTDLEAPASVLPISIRTD